tara:strand:+ start:122 stop:544 length:423 start_codon:yes stop_codon:yes gene_type:complete
MASNKKDLKAYVRYDGTGRTIAGSLILQRFKPKVGNWQEVQAYECCDPSCRIPDDYDWQVTDVYEVYGGVIMSLAINPFTTPVLQFQSLNCMGGPIGEIITVDESTNFEYNWFISTEMWDLNCAFQVRQVCGFNYTSNWK